MQTLPDERMDEDSILATADALADVLSALSTTTPRIARLRQTWQGALLLENQLSTLYTALNQIQQWIRQPSPSLHQQRVMDLDRCIACCRLLITKVDADMSQLEQCPAGDVFRLIQYMRTRNLKRVQGMIQEQSSALTIWIMTYNPASISQKRDPLENVQASRKPLAVEDTTTFGVSHGRTTSMSSPSIPSTPSTPSSSSTSIFSRASQRSFKFILGSSSRSSSLKDRQSHLTLEAGGNLSGSPAPSGSEETQGPVADGGLPAMVETTDKFFVQPGRIPVETRDKFLLHGPVETQDKFIFDPSDINDKFILSKEAVDPSDKFAVTKVSPTLQVPDNPNSISDLGGSATRNSKISSVKDRWKPRRLLSPVRDRKASQGQLKTSGGGGSSSSSSTRNDHKRGQQHIHKVLVIGSKSRLHILAAARKRDRDWNKEHSPQELDRYRELIWKNLRTCTRVLIAEMRRFQIHLEAEYLRTYVRLIDGYLHDIDDDNGPHGLDGKFFEALIPLLQHPPVAKLVKQSCSRRDVVLPQTADYFFASIARISAWDFVPNELDILYLSSFSSTSESTCQATVREGDLNIELNDIGNLEGKSLRWVHHFKASQCVIFVVDLEDCDDSGKVAEIKQFLNSMVASKWFLEASITLLINVGSAPTNSSSSDASILAEMVIGNFQDLRQERLHISPCDVTGNGGTAIPLMVSTLKEAIVTKALREEWKMLI